MARYGRSGIGDFIPTAGEGRALVELKGKVGKMRSSYYRGSRGRFNAIRQGRTRRKPQTWIPLASGDQSLVTDRGVQPWARHRNSGSVVTAAADQAFLWVISPELVGSAKNPTVVAVGGEADPDMKYKVVGITGHLFWTPAFSLADPNQDPLGWTGFIRVFWGKIKAMPEPGGSGVAEYPWSGGWTDPADSSGSHLSSLVNFYDDASVDTEANQRALALRDVRYRTDIMRTYVRPWHIPYMPVAWYDSDDHNVVQEYLPQAARPIQIPLPRKLVCSVGRGESLACWYQIVSQSSVPSASAPTGQFDFTDVKVKVYADI